MPIRLQETMPVLEKLEQENIFVMASAKAEHQDIRQLRIAIVNIMPQKELTELQLLRLLSNSPLQVEVTFLRLVTHHYKNVTNDYLERYYKTFSEIRSKKFDGLIITGAPVENLEYEQVDYWDELSEIMEWSKHNVTSTMHLCWAAQAGLYYHYGIQKYSLKEKLSGIYRHYLTAAHSMLTRGFDDMFDAPHSRYTGIHAEDIYVTDGIDILAESDEAGPYIVSSKDGRHVFVNGHPEYDAGTLASEYWRDVNKGIHPNIPKNYFPDDDPQRPPIISWKAHSNLLVSNWLNYCVYQITPYEL